MFRKGLSLLKPNLEEKIGVEFLDEMPPLFSQFLRFFQVGENSLFFDKIMIEKGELRWFTKIEMFKDEEMNGENYTAVIDHVFSIKKLKEELVKWKNKEENWNIKGFMQIGLLYHGDVLLIGMENQFSDEIWRYGIGLSNTVLSKLDDNIFDFFSRLNTSIDDEEMEELNINENQIYKNLVEDFWRIRPV
jgi:hypothetical protein